MKEPKLTLAPIYASMYPGLCEISKQNGYALAVFGSLTRDLDLIACPWTEDAVSAEVLVNDLLNHSKACLYPELLRRHNVPEYHIKQIAERPENISPKAKPHGRQSWSLHFEHGAYIDLHVWPLAPVVGGRDE